MKHLFTSLLLLCATAVTAHDFEVGGIYYNITDATNKTVAVTYKGSSYSAYSNEYTGSVVIPESVTYNGTTYSVTSIGMDAFSGCTGLTSIVIPNSDTSIGDGAFRGCTGLTSIKIPNSVTSIGDWAFSGCSGLTNVVIGNSVTSIEEYAFNSCSGLTSIEIPNSVTSVGYAAFAYCSGLTSIVIPNSVTSIGYGAFADCSGLTSIEVDGNNTKYDSRENCNAIIETETNTLILGCNNTVIPNSVTSIENYAFSGCSGLTSIVIPNSVTTIGWVAFSGCTGLTSIVIPNSVTTIGEDAFNGCTSLKDLHIADGEGTLSLGYNGSSKGIFYDCPLETLYLGRDLSGGNPPSYNKSTLTSVTIGNSVTSIGDYAFYNCSGLTSVVIPNSVTSIGDGAFYNCSGLTSIEIPNSVTSIGYRAFEDCSGLTSIEIGKSVTSIGSLAFYNCTGLTSITSLIPAESLFAIDSYVFDNVDKTVCTLYVPVGTKETYASTEGWKDFVNIVEKDFTGIDEVFDEVKGEPTVDASQIGKVKTVYDLNGRAVENPAKGIYIINGKKVLIK